jgi:phosphoribosyl 1,2-cyclic phosphodiesterase
MTMRLTVLASGSGGNATLIESHGFGVLLDAGLGPRQLGERLTTRSFSWDLVQAVLLTHTHTDHWNEATMGLLRTRQIPVYCHPLHAAGLRRATPVFAELEAAGLVRPYEADTPLRLALGLYCHPLPVRHDSGATFGFRFEGRPTSLFGDPPACAYLADLGTWDEPLADAVRDVDLLALEFNHDEDLERGSGRQPRLIARVIGDEGHLSNAQAAAFLVAVLKRSRPGRLRRVVQLHLSRQCNRPALAKATARAALPPEEAALDIVPAHQDRPLPTFVVGEDTGRPRRKPRLGGANRTTSRRPALVQPWLPGLE